MFNLNRSCSNDSSGRWWAIPLIVLIFPRVTFTSSRITLKGRRLHADDEVKADVQQLFKDQLLYGRYSAGNGTSASVLTVINFEKHIQFSCYTWLYLLYKIHVNTSITVLVNAIQRVLWSMFKQSFTFFFFNSRQIKILRSLLYSSFHWVFITFFFFKLHLNFHIHFHPRFLSFLSNT